MRIKELRESHNVQQKELALELGISPNTLSQYENGKRELGIDVLKKISKYFNVSTDYLLCRDSFVQCDICHNLYDPLNEIQVREHDEFHRKFVECQDKYGEILNYSNADKLRESSILNFRNPSRTIDERLESFQDYLKYDFMLYIWKCHFSDIEMDFDEYSKLEASKLKRDALIPNELFSKIKESYGAFEIVDGTELTKRDERDIKKDLETLIEKLELGEDGPAAFDGEEIPEGDQELFAGQLELMLRRLKVINKEKYNPNKNKDKK